MAQRTLALLKTPESYWVVDVEHGRPIEETAQESCCRADMEVSLALAVTRNRNPGCVVYYYDGEQNVCRIH